MNCNPIRIALLTSSFPRYPGDPTVEYIYRLVQGLSRSLPAQVDVVAPTDCRDYIFPPERDLAVHRFVYFLPQKLQKLAYGSGMPDNLRAGLLPRLQVPFFLLSFFFAGYRVVRKADCIYAHWIVPAGLVGACLVHLLDRKMVLSIHSGGLHFLRRFPGGKFLARFIVTASAHITVVYPEQSECLLEMLPEKMRERTGSKVRVVPMGIEWERYQSPFSKEKLRNRYGISTRFVVVFLGRLVRVKGLEILIRALAGRDDITLLVLGEGRERPICEKLARKLRVTARFSGMVGGQTKIDYLHLSDIMVQPSVTLPDGRTEGVPVSLLEGMACGLPVIASRIGGIPEVLKDGEEGFLIPPGDPKWLKSKIEQLLADEVLRRRMGEKGRRTASDYDWNKVINSLASFFTQ